MAGMEEEEPLERWATVARDLCGICAGVWLLGAVVACLAVLVFDVDSDLAVWRVLGTIFFLGVILTGAMWLAGEVRRGYRSND